MDKVILTVPGLKTGKILRPDWKKNETPTNIVLRNACLISERLNLGVYVTRKIEISAEVLFGAFFEITSFPTDLIKKFVFENDSFFHENGIFIDPKANDSGLASYMAAFLAYDSFNISDPEILRAIAHFESGPLPYMYFDSSIIEKVFLLANYIDDCCLDHEKLALSALTSTQNLDFALFIVLTGEVLNELKSSDTPDINRNILHLWRTLYSNRDKIFGDRSGSGNKYVDYIRRSSDEINKLLGSFLTKQIGKVPNYEIAYFHNFVGEGKLIEARRRPLLQEALAKGALACFEQALKFDPSYYVATKGKGDALIYLGREDEGRRCIAEALGNIGLDFKKKGYSAMAEQFFRDAIKACQNYYPIWLELSEIEGNRHNYAGAISCLDEIIKAIDVDLALRAKAYGHKGGYISLQSRILEATYSTMINLLPKQGETLLTEERDYKKEAICCYDAAIKCNRQIIILDGSLEEVLNAYLSMIQLLSAKAEIENYTTNLVEGISLSEEALSLIQSFPVVLRRRDQIKLLHSRILAFQGSALYSLGFEREALDVFNLVKALKVNGPSVERSLHMAKRISLKLEMDYVEGLISTPQPLA